MKRTKRTRPVLIKCHWQPLSPALYLQCLEQRLAKVHLCPYSICCMNVILVKKDDGHSCAADTGLGLEKTLKLVCFLKWALKSQLPTLPSLAFLWVVTSSAPGFDCQRCFRSLPFFIDTHSWTERPDLFFLSFGNLCQCLIPTRLFHPKGSYSLR